MEFWLSKKKTYAKSRRYAVWFKNAFELCFQCEALAHPSVLKRGLER
jgi:hypothetical protein